MPPLSFATLELATSNAVVSAFANAAISWTGHSGVGVFDAAYADPLGMSNSSPSIACLDSVVASLAVDTVVSIVRSGVTTAYTVREKQPDGLGVTRLILQRA